MSRRGILHGARQTLGAAGDILKAAIIFVLWNVMIVPMLLLPPLWATLWMMLAVALLYYVHIGRALRPGREQKRATLRLRPPGAAVPWALAAALPMFCVSLSGTFLLIWLGFPPALRGSDLLQGYALQPFGWLPLAVMVVLFAPILEELVFRGWIQRSLERRFGALPGILLAAALFAVAHGASLGNTSRFLMGLVLGCAVYLSRSIWTSIILHAAHNAIIMALGPLTEQALPAGGALQPWMNALGGPQPFLAMLLVSLSALVWMGWRAHLEIGALAFELEPATVR